MPTQPTPRSPESSGAPATSPPPRRRCATSCVTARNRRSLAELAEAAERLTAQVLALPEVRRAASVSAYVSVGHEPGTSRLLDALLAAGKRVVLPLTVRDPGGFLDLDWAVYAGPASLAPARYGLLEPTTPPLGPRRRSPRPTPCCCRGWRCPRRATGSARAAGCYDRALARVPVGTFTCVLLYDDEVGRDVPVEPHDRPVVAAATPSGAGP